MQNSAPTVLMLLTNAYDPDPRVRQEALALLGMGCQVRILAWDRDRKRPPLETMEGVVVERIYLNSTHGRGSTQMFFYALLYLRLIWRALRTRFDALHCHDLDTLPAGWIIARLRRRPLIYDAHESFPDMLSGSVPLAVRSGLFRLENFLIRRVDLLITVGEKLRRHFAERGARHSVVVGNWKRLSEFTRTAEENNATRQVLGIPPDALTVVCITQLLRDRQLEELLDAVDRDPDVHVIIGGGGVLEPMVRERAALNPRIKYLGFVGTRRIADLTCAADIVYYGFDPQNPNARFSAPNKLYEALAAGRPLITGDFGEIAEVVRQSGCGIVLERYSADDVGKALAVLANPETRAQMAERALACGRAAHNWEKGEQVLHREYSALIAGLAKPAAAAVAVARS